MFAGKAGAYPSEAPFTPHLGKVGFKLREDKILKAPTPS